MEFHTLANNLNFFRILPVYHAKKLYRTANNAFLSYAFSVKAVILSQVWAKDANYVQAH